MPSPLPTSPDRETIHEALRAWPAQHNLVLPDDGPRATPSSGGSRSDSGAGR